MPVSTHPCTHKLSKTTTISLLFLKIYTANPIEVALKFDSTECHLTFNIGDDLYTYLHIWFHAELHVRLGICLACQISYHNFVIPQERQLPSTDSSWASSWTLLYLL